MLERLIIFIIRCKYGLKRGQCFKFTNQKKDVLYFFGRNRLWKMWPDKYNEKYAKVPGAPFFVESDVSLNWLLDANCSIRKVKLPWPISF